MGDSFLAPIEQPLEIFISSTAQRSKPEVVEGMLVERGLLSLLESQALRPSFVAGEQFQLANEQEDSNQTLRLLNRDQLEFLIPESIQISAFANYSQGYNYWLRSLHPSAVIADQKIQQAIKKTQQHVQAHVRDLQAKIAQDARFKHGIRDEQVLFLSALKFYYMGLLKR